MPLHPTWRRCESSVYSQICLHVRALPVTIVAWCATGASTVLVRHRISESNHEAQVALGTSNVAT